MLAALLGVDTPHLLFLKRLNRVRLERPLYREPLSPLAHLSHPPYPGRQQAGCPSEREVSSSISHGEEKQEGPYREHEGRSQEKAEHLHKGQS